MGYSIPKETSGDNGSKPSKKQSDHQRKILDTTNQKTSKATMLENHGENGATSPVSLGWHHCLWVWAKMCFPRRIFQNLWFAKSDPDPSTIELDDGKKITVNPYM